MPSLAAAAAPAVTLPRAIDEIVVTGISTRLLADVPRSVSVITADEIALAPASDLTELLAREANVNLRSVTGNDKFAGVDIRGLGDTFVSNVLVLVDGIRLNPPDLAGADFASVALPQVERVEIVRGANAVRYGGGAVGGVINIIMRPPAAGPRLSAQAGAGTFGTLDAALSASAGDGPGGAWDAAASAAWYDTDGYRENGNLERGDLQLRGRVRPTTGVTLDAGIQLHADRYGLPGPVSAEAFGTESGRRGSQTPDDGGESRDWRYRLGAGFDIGAGHAVRVLAGYRDRQNQYVLGYTPLLSRADQQDEITERTTTAEVVYEFPMAVGPGRQQVTLGASTSRSDYQRSEDGDAQVGQSTRLAGDLVDGGLFAAVTWSLGDRWQLSAGQRVNSTSLDSTATALDEVCDQQTVPGIPFPIPVNCRPEWTVAVTRDERWSNAATDVGAVVELGDQASAYASASRAFRSPNVDELVLATPDLGPQQSRHLEAGVRLVPATAVEMSLAAFYMEVTDEILYSVDPETGEGLNRNAGEETRRVGGEVELRWQLLAGLRLTADAGFTRARFANGGRLPLVPEWTAAVAARWSPVQAVTASAAWRFAGDRPDGNDFAGTAYPELDAYGVADLALRWDARFAAWSLAVENLFDTAAAASGYSGSLYPIAGRAYRLGISKSF
jgi:outer membrane receptor protein involved in Fe transport